MQDIAQFLTWTAPLDWVTFLIRAVFALAVLPYGVEKLKKIGQPVQFFTVMGIPASVGFYMVMVIETLVPVLVFFGLFTRLALIPIIGSFSVATKVTWGQMGLSPALVFLLLAIALFIIGPGALSLDALWFSAL